MMGVPGVTLFVPSMPQAIESLLDLGFVELPTGRSGHSLDSSAGVIVASMLPRDHGGPASRVILGLTTAIRRTVSSSAPEYKQLTGLLLGAAGLMGLSFTPILSGIDDRATVVFRLMQLTRAAAFDGMYLVDWGGGVLHVLAPQSAS